ncbi:MAG: hypothetical protein AAFR52_01790 [Pseudomonadota bacterium]
MSDYPKGRQEELTELLCEELEAIAQALDSARRKLADCSLGETVDLLGASVCYADAADRNVSEPRQLTIVLPQLDEGGNPVPSQTQTVRNSFLEYDAIKRVLVTKTIETQVPAFPSAGGVNYASSPPIAPLNGEICCPSEPGKVLRTIRIGGFTMSWCIQSDLC